MVDRTSNIQLGGSLPMKQSIAIFASGSGSNFDRIALKALGEDLPCDVKLLVCDKPDAPVIQKAETLGIETLVFQPKNFSHKEAYEKMIVQRLEALDVDWLILAGYMRLLGETMLEAYQGKILNVHPSLLPSFPGKDAIGQALEAKVTETGVTIHFVDEGMDTGPIIQQESVDVTPDDDRESLQRKIQKIEHELYPIVIHRCLEGEIKPCHKRNVHS